MNLIILMSVSSTTLAGSLLRDLPLCKTGHFPTWGDGFEIFN